MDQVGGDGLAAGHPGAADDVDRLVLGDAEQLGDGRGRRGTVALLGLPGVARRARPAELGRADGHADARRRDGGADAPAALEAPFELQLLQRLAERGPRDAEARGEVALVRQYLADGELGVECLTEHGPEVPVLRLRHRFQLRGPHPDPPQSPCPGGVFRALVY